MDEILAYLAPTLLGEGPGMFGVAPPATLAKRTLLNFHAVDRIGDDIRILARFGKAPAASNPAPHG